ncbi:MAG: hypothetical protein RLZZ115_3332, partial [Cyanobacteriota bacterium]
EARLPPTMNWIYRYISDENNEIYQSISSLIND